MASEFLYLTTVGRTTGKSRQIEIWFVEYRGCCYLVSELRERAGWVKNLTQQPRVVFSVGTRRAPTCSVPDTTACARVVHDSAEPELVAAVKQRMDDKYGWSDGLVVELRPTADDISAR